MTRKMSLFFLYLTLFGALISAQSPKWRSMIRSHPLTMDNASNATKTFLPPLPWILA